MYRTETHNIKYGIGMTQKTRQFIACLPHCQAAKDALAKGRAQVAAEPSFSVALQNIVPGSIRVVYSSRLHLPFSLSQEPFGLSRHVAAFRRPHPYTDHPPFIAASHLVNPNPNVHTINVLFTHFEYMKAAVQPLKSEAIQATWHLYCEDDAVVPITVRKMNDLSPNSMCALS